MTLSIKGGEDTKIPSGANGPKYRVHITLYSAMLEYKTQEQEYQQIWLQEHFSTFQLCLGGGVSNFLDSALFQNDLRALKQIKENIFCTFKCPNFGRGGV